MPQVPAVPGTPGLTQAVEAAFANDGALARAVDQFEPRESQRAMAGAVSETLQQGGILLAEAGTGTQRHRNRPDYRGRDGLVCSLGSRKQMVSMTTTKVVDSSGRAVTTITVYERR